MSLERRLDLWNASVVQRGTDRPSARIKPFVCPLLTGPKETATPPAHTRRRRPTPTMEPTIALTNTQDQQARKDTNDCTEKRAPSQHLTVRGLSCCYP